MVQQPIQQEQQLNKGITEKINQKVQVIPGYIRYAFG
jgi:hypothetical protein